MKKLLSVILLAAVILSTFSIGVYAASDAYKATWTLKASVLDASSKQDNDKNVYLNTSSKTVYDSKNTPTVSVYPGQVVWVTLHLKTGASYYPDTLQAQIFYTNGIFASTNSTASKSYIWNTSGKFTKACLTSGAPYSKMIETYKRDNYPPSWSDAKKASIEFYSVVMVFNTTASTKAVSNIDEDLVTVPIYVKSNAKIGSTGSVFITGENKKSKSNPTGNFILSYFENGDVSSTPVVYTDKTTFDTSKSEIKFVVADKNAPALTLSDTNIKMNYKDKTQLTAVVKDKPNAKITWESSDTKVAVVDSEGNVTATGKGTAIITAKYGDTKAECTVKVSYTFVQMIIRILLFGWLWY